MSLNIEQTVVEWLNNDPALADIPASMSVPPERPTRFITVELTGGPIEAHRAQPILSIQAWDESRYKAADLATGTILPRLQRLTDLSEIASVDVESVYNNPDPGPPQSPRYQINLQITQAV